MFYRDTFVGKDASGNRYYKKGTKRFVVYASKDCDPTTISTKWYLWLHNASDLLPTVSQDLPIGSSEDIEEVLVKKPMDTYIPWRPE
ncbi:hypothetical protein NHE_0506 [Neorickettsia helminthoeca str. Oregon]|uniref:Uncharacterized protein n=1 Tax=Neorickettsia helminthoeca str. Oregon TaxID=1286528 RepID=X5H439_9RICK|nr:NADH-ubiquinone oxidoreductase subunit NDUFA12 family protein [Neorickettsia helminthoeca]AHX11448.1 hypothetical protein NHE_0506 [Neorickettsia helminthoeca str. Oregon]